MAKKRKSKLPKRIAGIKIPKRVRKGPVAAFLSSQAGQIAVAEALALAASALAVKRSTDAGGETPEHPPHDLKSTGGRAVDAVGDRSARFAAALRAAAETFRNVMSEDRNFEVRPMEAGTEPRSMDDVVSEAPRKKSATPPVTEPSQERH
jgi:hypothetical protein